MALVLGNDRSLRTPVDAPLVMKRTRVDPRRAARNAGSNVTWIMTCRVDVGNHARHHDVSQTSDLRPRGGGRSGFPDWHRKVVVGERLAVPRFVVAASELMPKIAERPVDGAIRLPLVVLEDFLPGPGAARMSAAMSSVSSPSDITTRSGGGSPSSNAMLRSKCDRSNLGLMGMVQSKPIFDAVPGAASSAIIGSTVIVLCLEERRRVVLMVRGTPLHGGHIDLMARATANGAIIMPPVPAPYALPRSLDDMVD